MASALQSMTLEEAQVLALKVLKQVMEEKLDHNNVQLAQSVPGQKFEILSKDKLQQVITRLEA